MRSIEVSPNDYTPRDPHLLVKEFADGQKWSRAKIDWSSRQLAFCRTPAQYITEYVPVYMNRALARLATHEPDRFAKHSFCTPTRYSALDRLFDHNS